MKTYTLFLVLVATVATVALVHCAEGVPDTWIGRAASDAPQRDSARSESFLQSETTPHPTLTPEQKARARKQWTHFSSFMKRIYNVYVRPRLEYILKHRQTKWGSLFKNNKPLNLGGWWFKLPTEFQGMTTEEAEKTLFGLSTAETDEMKKAAAAQKPGKNADSFLEVGTGREEYKPMVDAQYYELDKNPIKNYNTWLKRQVKDDIPVPPNLDKLMEKMHEGIPKEWNFYKAYPACQRAGIDQGKCGSCWAFATVGMFTHRTCKAVVDAKLSIPKDWRLSPQSLVSCCSHDCCPSMGNCCRGGNILSALIYLRPEAVHPGSWEHISKQYGNGRGDKYGRNMRTLTCAAYEAGEGDQSPDECAADKKECDLYAQGKPGPAKAFARDPVYGVTIINKSKYARFYNHLHENPPNYWRGGPYSYWPAKIAMEHRVTRIQRELLANGPISMGFRVPASFPGFTGKGVFRRTGPYFKNGGHGVVLMGWGVEGDGTPYWLLENSWGDKYTDMPEGYKHMFKIRRGTNECMIESFERSCVASDPALEIDGKIVEIADGWSKVMKQK